MEDKIKELKRRIKKAERDGMKWSLYWIDLNEELQKEKEKLARR